jgi:flagellar hook-associated protein 1
MGLSMALGNALAGMRVGQSSLEILSRNVSNAGTPGYHRQSLGILEQFGSSAFPVDGGLQRAFNTSLETYYSRAISDGAYAQSRASILDRLQLALGKPGDPGSLDTLVNELNNKFAALSVSPEDFATRSEALSQAQTLAGTLNRLSNEVQGLRQETESQIGVQVGQLNQMLTTLSDINYKLADRDTDPATDAALKDQRDRLVSQISEMVDVRADYRADGTVALMTRSGVGLLDGGASTFEFQPAGRLSPSSLYDPNSNGVGSLKLMTPSGLKIDLVAGGGILQSGSLAALIELRDKTLVKAQGQLDDIAAALAQAFSTNQTDGTAVAVGPAAGFDVDIADVRSGNDFVINYTQAGVDKTLKVVRVDDASKLPMDYVDATGARVVGLSFTGGAASVATQLGALVPGLAFSAVGSTLRVLDDGAAGTTDVSALVARTTASANRDDGPGLSLFVDPLAGDFTNSLDGQGQKLGFAARIAVSGAVIADNKLLVQHVTDAPLGDTTRADHFLDHLTNMRFNSTTAQNALSGEFQLSGTVAEIVNQTMNFQGDTVANALATQESQALTMETLTQRLDNEYGVDVNEEMARLMELQAAFAANAKIVSAVQELLDALMDTI